MSKEYILAIMNKKDGYLVQDIEFKDELQVYVQMCDAVACSKVVAVRDNDADFTESSLKRVKTATETINNENKKYIPVIIECDIKFKTLDGKEIDREKLVEEYRKNASPIELLQGLLH